MSKVEQVMTGFWDLFHKRIYLDECRMKEALKGYLPSEVHCLEYIGKNADSNVTKLAEAFYMTRSAMSKIARKLTEKGLVESYQKPDNRKEIYFRLTEKGNEVFSIHEELHRESAERDSAVFDAVTEEQLETMLHFVEAYGKHLDGEIKKTGGDVRAGCHDKL